jgi:hypothetical protein
LGDEVLCNNIGAGRSIYIFVIVRYLWFGNRLNGSSALAKGSSCLHGMEDHMEFIHVTTFDMSLMI